MEHTLFDKVLELKDRFKSFFSHKKKLQALENYSNCAPFQHKDYLTLIKRCMADGFLGEKEADFLCYMLEKYELNFLDWSHRTKWLKSEMQKLASHYQKDKPEQMTMLDCPEVRSSVNPYVPFEILAKHHKQQQSRRV